MEKKENNLWPEDKELFATMQTKSISPEEFNFFQNMRFKEKHEATLSNDLIMSEHSNSENIYIVRVIFDEYVVGCALHPADEVHVMNLNEALNVKLADIGVNGNNNSETIWQWLRSINYAGIMYNHNFDKI